MKKVLALMLVAVLCVTSVFALDFSFGYMPCKNSGGEPNSDGDYLNQGQFTKATISQDLGNVEIGLSFSSPIPVKFVKAFVGELAFDSFSGAWSSIGDGFTAALKAAEDKLQYSSVDASVLFNLVTSDSIKLGVGAGVCLNNFIEGDKKGIDTELVVDAIAKFTLKLSSHLGVYASTGFEALKVDFSESDSDMFVPLWKTDDWQGTLLGALSVGLTYSL